MQECERPLQTVRESAKAVEETQHAREGAVAGTRGARKSTLERRQGPGCVPALSREALGKANKFSFKGSGRAKRFLRSL